jgi:hypothetical protein
VPSNIIRAGAPTHHEFVVLLVETESELGETILYSHRALF